MATALKVLYHILPIFSLVLSTVSHDKEGIFLDNKQAKRGGQNDRRWLDALERSVQRNPMVIWYFKEKYKTLQDMLLSSDLLGNEVVERATTNERLQHTMTKALLGHDISLTVMGGSISAGGGLINDNVDLRGIYYRVFTDWWQKAVQPFTSSKIELRNLAVGGTASNFYFDCYKSLLKPRESMDIVFLEFSVNDYLVFKDSKLPEAMPLEELTRSILTEPNSPAVIFVNFIQGNQGVAQCDNLENHGQTMLAWHYGITSVSMRSSLCPNPAKKETPTMFSSDGNHASSIAHAQVAMMIIENVRSVILGSMDNLKRGTFNEPSQHLPRNVYYSMGKENTDSKPLCFTLITPDINDKYFNPSLFLKETQNVGFEKVHNKIIGFHKSVQGNNTFAPSRSDGFGGWHAEKENATLKLLMFLPRHEILGVNVTRSIVLLFRTNGFGAKAEIWLDGSKPGVIIDTHSLFGRTLLSTVANHVTSGSHVLNVKTLNAGPFTLCGVIARGNSMNSDLTNR